MDETDRAIIDQLQVDARTPNTVLADLVHLTPGPCLRRVKRLESDGVILGYQAQVDPKAIEQAFEVFLEIELVKFDKDSIERFETTIASYRQVVELYRMFGSPDYFARVAVADLAAYERFLSDHILTSPGIDRVSSRFPMKVMKSLRPQSSL